jgi:DNA polymerase elongation subunit (family B)
MQDNSERLPLCGLWIAPDCTARLCVAAPDGGRREVQAQFRPFAWLRDQPPEIPPGAEVSPLSGDGLYPFIAHNQSLDSHDAFLKKIGAAAVDNLRPLESQFLLQQKLRLFDGLRFAQLRRCQLDIETAAAGGDHFSDPTLPGDRVLAIGLKLCGRTEILELTADTDEAERELLLRLNTFLATEDPDTIEGHNIFKFDLDYLKLRAKRLKVPTNWGRFGQKASFRSSRLKLAERWIDFPRCDLPGRTVVDTYLLAQLHDVATRELNSYGLKDLAIHFGITAEEQGERTYLAGSQIQYCFQQDRERFRAYLRDDLRETAGLADLLLPTYFEQAKAFPTTLQEATLRGNSNKIDLLFLEEYYHRRAALPGPTEVATFEGGYSRSFREGVFHHVLHFDVASLYPSLLLSIGRNPSGDALGVFIPMLRSLREYRLRYKALARSETDPDLRTEYTARQNSFKILINSFYGYLGFPGARFGDGELAAEVTRRGRELLQSLIAEFDRQGCTILEADTDGIYLSSEKWYNEPAALLASVAPVLPAGIELDYDGSYQAMFCYKAKNYALYDGQEVVIRGSALRSRGIEPYLKRLGEALVHHLLGAGGPAPMDLLVDYRKRIADRTAPVEELARSENLGQSADSYEKMIAEGGKPRRASAEAALQLTPRPGMGDRVAYYLTPKRKGATADWQRARPVALFDPVLAPYDPAYYLGKIDDWLERYGAFLGGTPPPAPGELF